MHVAASVESTRIRSTRTTLRQYLEEGEQHQDRGETCTRESLVVSTRDDLCLQCSSQRQPQRAVLSQISKHSCFFSTTSK